MTKTHKYIKRLLDLILSLILILILFLPIFILFMLCSFDTKSLGIFIQERVGKDAKIFKIYKLKTYNSKGYCSSFGKVLRRSKLDELPQIFNVIIGNMSFVGPRPDIIGFADELIGEDRIILDVKPGITGPATLKFYNEEELLEKQCTPEIYNKEVIWQEKILINKEYIKNYSIFKDVKIIIKTIINVF